MSTKDAMRILPLDKEIRMRLLENYPEKMTFDKRKEIEDLTWKLFYEYFDVVYETLLRKHALEHPGSSFDGLQDKFLKETEELILNDYHTNVTNVQLDELRSKIATLSS